MTGFQLEPFFSGPGLDRADAMRPDEEGIRALAASPLARQLQWREGLPELSAAGRVAWSRATNPQLFLGLDGEIPCFCAIEGAIAETRTAIGYLALLDAADAPIVAAALSLSRWHLRHRFCANCGHLTEIVRGGWSRRCPKCAAEHYPRVDPVVIMLVERDGNVLLGRQPQFPQARYSALAGFVEVGESLEAAVIREVSEEVGLCVHGVRYVASQPWPFPSSLMIGCIAAARDATLTIDTTELEDARWFSREEVAEALGERTDAAFQPPPRIAIARTLLEHWQALELAKTRP